MPEHIAKQMVEQIQADDYAKTYNEAVWNGKTSKELNAMLDAFPSEKLAKMPSLSGKVLAGGAGVVGKVAKGVGKHLGSIVAVGTFFVGVADGGTVYDESLDALMSATWGDSAKWAVEENPLTKTGTKVFQENNYSVKEALDNFDKAVGGSEETEP